MDSVETLGVDLLASPYRSDHFPGAGSACSTGS